MLLEHTQTDLADGALCDPAAAVNCQRVEQHVVACRWRRLEVPCIALDQVRQLLKHRVTAVASGPDASHKHWACKGNLRHALLCSERGASIQRQLLHVWWVAEVVDTHTKPAANAPPAAAPHSAGSEDTPATALSPSAAPSS